MEKCVIFAIKKNHFKVCCPRVGKKVHEIEKDKTDEPSHQSNYEFFIETVNIQDSAHFNQIKNGNSDWSITLPSNGVPLSYKIDTDYEFFIETVNIRDSAHFNQIKYGNSDWSIALPSNGVPVSYKIDTGAQCSVIPLTILKNFDPARDLCPVIIKLSTYNNSKIPVLGKCSLTLKHKKYHFDVSFTVVDSKSMPNTLGLATSESLNLIKRISVVNVSHKQFLFEFFDCLGETGTLKNTHHIEIKANVTPEVHPIRKIPLALEPKLEKELKRMVDWDIIEPVQKPTDWVNGLVVVEKPNRKLWICPNPRSLDKAIKRKQLHPPPLC